MYISDVPRNQIIFNHSSTSLTRPYSVNLYNSDRNCDSKGCNEEFTLARKDVRPLERRKNLIYK